MDIVENNETKWDRTPAFDVILDSQREKYPFILNGEFIITDDEPFQLKRFDKDSNQFQLNLSIEKIFDRMMRR